MLIAIQLVIVYIGARYYCGSVQRDVIYVSSNDERVPRDSPRFRSSHLHTCNCTLRCYWQVYSQLFVSFFRGLSVNRIKIC